VAAAVAACEGVAAAVAYEEATTAACEVVAAAVAYEGVTTAVAACEEVAAAVAYEEGRPSPACEAERSQEWQAGGEQSALEGSQAVQGVVDYLQKELAQ
jgi:hypothetical protein